MSRAAATVRAFEQPSGDIALLPLLLGDVELECLRDTTFGLYPEARLASFLLRSLPAHKDHQDSVRIEVARSARDRAKAGERFGFRLIASAHDLPRLQAMAELLQHGFTAQDLGEDHAFGNNWRLVDAARAIHVQVLDQHGLAVEAARWQHTTQFRLRLLSPTRIALRRDGARGRQRYCRHEAELDDAILCKALTASLVSLKFALNLPRWRIPELPLRVLSKRLSLLDPGGRSTQRGAKPLDEGLLGEVVLEWTSPPTPAQWQHLVLLQYLGVGQARSFGLGQMQIETLDGVTYKRVSAVRGDRLVAVDEPASFVRAQVRVA